MPHRLASAIQLHALIFQCAGRSKRGADCFGGVCHLETIAQRAQVNALIVGELLAISAIVVCLLSVTVDLGRPDRFWHLIPPIGWMGMALIIASGIAATALRNRALPQAPAEEH